ncbi:phage major capsid protein [Limosilactobacillus reuteri]|uniref:phage major capsid protein n=1 Tax=Limosilactobacillus reuteri TaxID=1598 RepID=UPI00115A15DA|nr:phage major capsid protein [Limosilactobacillus reuteri]QDK48702.1 hypothetical protein DPH67_06230 [Limosilactobacillus reuteri]
MITTKNKKINIRALPVKQSELRAVNNNDGSYTVSGYAVVFNQPSQPLPFIEYISRDALNDVDFSKTLLLYAHDYNKILARADSATLKTEIDDTGLKFTAQIPDTTLGTDTFKNIQAGNVKGCSFGFTIAGGGDRWDTRQDGTTVHYVDKIDTVSELTLTAIPAYEETSVSAQVKRDLEQYLNNKEEQDLNSKDNSEVVRSSAVASSAASTATSSAASSATSTEEIDEIVASAVSAAVSGIKTAVSAACHPGSAAKRDDVDDSDVDNTEDDSDIEDDSQGNQSSPASTAASSAVATDSAASSNTSSAVSSATRQNQQEDNNKEEHRAMIDITPNQQSKSEQITREFKNYLLTRDLTGELKRDTANVGLPTGSVLIPKTIMAPEHEQHQFPRLGSLVHNVSVSTTTGIVPVFQTTDQKLQTKAEFDHSADASSKLIKQIAWTLKSYGSKFTTSRDLLMDSNYDWISELQQTLGDLKDNTDDSLIANALITNAANKVTATDAIADIKTALNVNLKPVDSRNAQIILSQSAYNALDQLKDGFGRPLLQPDPTNATSNRLFGKTVIVVDDNLLGKAGEANVVVTPLDRSIYSFNEGQVSGQFLDNFDVFDVVLGVFVRKDVEVARPDLITTIKLTQKSVAASDAGTGTGK